MLFKILCKIKHGISGEKTGNYGFSGNSIFLFAKQRIMEDKSLRYKVKAMIKHEKENFRKLKNKRQQAEVFA